MQDFFQEYAAHLVTAFWMLLISAVGMYMLLKRGRGRSPAMPSDMKSQNKMFLERALREEADMQKTVKVVHVQQVPSEASRRRKGRAILPQMQLVDFDPKDKEHCKAIQLLMQNPSRQHPVLRFHFDPSTHDSAYAYILSVLVNYHCEKINKSSVTKKAKAVAAPPPHSVVPLYRGAATPVKSNP